MNQRVQRKRKKVARTKGGGIPKQTNYKANLNDNNNLAASDDATNRVKMNQSGKIKTNGGKRMRRRRRKKVTLGSNKNANQMIKSQAKTSNNDDSNKDIASINAQNHVTSGGGETEKTLQTNDLQIMSDSEGL